MKKTISIFSIFIAALVGFTYELTIPITADTYTPQVEKVEVSATNASTYTLDYPVTLRQVHEEGGVYTYTNENTLNSDADLSSLSNLYIHKAVSQEIITHSVNDQAKVGGYGTASTYRNIHELSFGAIPIESIDNLVITQMKMQNLYSTDASTWRWIYVYPDFTNPWHDGGYFSVTNDSYYYYDMSQEIIITQEIIDQYNSVGVIRVETMHSNSSTNSWLDYSYDEIINIQATNDYIEYSSDGGTTWTQMSAASTSTQQYYSFTNVVDTGSVMSLDELSFSKAELTAEAEEYALLLTLTNLDATTIGDIVVDGVTIKHETDLAEGYIIDDSNTEIAIPFTNTLTIDGSITHTIDSIQVLNNGTWDTWTINQSHTIPVQLPIEQTAYYTNATFDKASVSFGDNYNLTIDVVNPDLYDIHAVTVNGVEFTYPATMSVNAEKTQITIPYTAQVVYGDNIHTIDSIEFMETADPWDSYIQTLGITKSISSNLTFTNDITVTGISIPGTSFLGDIPELVITLNNPEQLQVNYVNISGKEYTVFEINETNSVITIDWPVGIDANEFDFEVQHINFTKNIDGSDYQSSKLIQSPFSYEVLNPIDLANIRVKNFRSEELKAVVDSEFDLTLSIDNPSGYDIYSVSINGISRTDIITNDTNTIITIPVTAMHTEGRQVFVLDGVRFAHFNNIQTYRSLLVDDIVITVPIESYQFTREVNVVSIDLMDENVYVGDETSLLITLDNPNGYEITELSINGIDYQASQFDINDTNTEITIPTKIGDTEEVIFNLDSISIKRFNDIGTRIFEAITTFTVGSIYEKEIHLANNVWWAVFLYATLAPKIDWLIMDTWGQVTLGVILVAILGGIAAYIFTRDKEDKK